MTDKSLTPQNDKERELIRVVLAAVRDEDVEYRNASKDGWQPAHKLQRMLYQNEYRITPKPTPLPISAEMWAMIDPKYKCAVMAPSGAVYFSAEKPEKLADSWSHRGDTQHRHRRR